MVKPSTEQEFDHFLVEVHDIFYRGTFSNQQKVLKLLIDSSLVYAEKRLLDFYI